MHSMTTSISARQSQRRQGPPHHIQSGFSLIELLVALTISLLITLAAISALIVSRQGFTSIDASSQLRDNARFATDLIQRIVVQGGFRDVFYATQTVPTASEIAQNFAPNIMGFNNSLSSSTDPINSATTRSSSIVGYGSDVLVVRYQPAETFPGSGVSDGSMIDCNGSSVSNTGPINRNDRAASVFHIALSQGEPTLMCTSVSSDGTISGPNPIVQGVETFQVLYGVDGTTIAANTKITGAQDSVAHAYLRADQMVVAGDPASTDTYSNWRRVRSIRIGMVLRGPTNSQVERVSQTFYPFGKGKDSASGTAGYAMSSSADVNTRFTPTVDGRLRQVVTFTVHLRNDQDSALSL